MKPEPLTPKVPAPPLPMEIRPPGIHGEELRRDDGSLLRFTISVPENHGGDNRSPLIIALHYGGEVTPFYGRGVVEALVLPALEELQPIIVAPDSVGGRWTTSENERAVLQLMDSVMAAYNVDSSKTLLTGFSLGGEGTWHIGGRHQNRFSAAIPIAGMSTTDEHWEIPLHVIHSRQDELIPLKPTEDMVARLKAEGADITLRIIEGVTHFETARFGGPLREAIPWIRKSWGI